MIGSIITIVILGGILYGVHKWVKQRAEADATIQKSNDDL
jgi:hypothetical protein